MVEDVDTSRGQETIELVAKVSLNVMIELGRLLVAEIGPAELRKSNSSIPAEKKGR